MYLLDTDVCIAVIRGRASVIGRMREQRPGDLGVTAMTEAELRFGALNAANTAAGIAAVEALVASLAAVVPFDRTAARHHAEICYALRAQRIGERDLVIASVAVAYGVTLVTGNIREFSRVPGLVVENWPLA